MVIFNSYVKLPEGSANLDLFGMCRIHHRAGVPKSTSQYLGEEPGEPLFNSAPGLQIAVQPKRSSHDTVQWIHWYSWPR